MLRRNVLEAGIGGLIGLIGSAVSLPLPALAEQPSETTPREISIILDDVGVRGNELENLKVLKEAKVPVTFAVLPYRNSETRLREILQFISGYEQAQVILHQPMEPENMKNRGIEDNLEPRNRDGSVPIRTEDMAYDQNVHTAIYAHDADNPDLVRKILDNNIAYLNGILKKFGSKRVVGLNNHAGSRVTKSKEIAEVIVDYACENNLIVVDSMTIPNSALYKAGAETSDCPPVYQRHGEFLDDGIKGTKADYLADFRKVSERLIGLLKQDVKGPVIGIGHIRFKATVEVLKDVYLEIIRENLSYKFTTIKPS